MICSDVREQLPHYVDDRLGAADLVRVRSHLGDCQPCTHERDALELMDDLIAASLSDHPFGDEAVESLLTSLPLHQLRAAPIQPKKTPAPNRLVIGLITLAAAALLVALALQLIRGEGDTSPESVAEAEANPVVARAGEGIMLLGVDGQALTAGSQIRAGDRLVAVQNPASLHLEDGTVLELHADTEVRLVRDDDGGLTVHMQGAEGKVYCEVARRQAPFRVKARGLDVQVLGTKFVVEQYRLSSSVAVLNGRVLAATAHDRRELQADDRAEVFFRPQSRGKLVRTQGDARRALLWVPRIKQQLEHKPVVEDEPVQPTRPVKPKTKTKPDTKTKPHMDQPIVPPERKTGKKQGLAPPGGY